jgi:hypothetical protein
MSHHRSNRAWYRNKFYDHPKVSSNLDEAFVGAGPHQKARVFCQRCFDSCVAEQQAYDAMEITRGKQTTARENQVIEDMRAYSFL